MSLRARLTIGTACTLALAICAGFVAAYFVVRGQLRAEVDKSLSERAGSFVSFTRAAPGPIPSQLPRNLPRPKLGGAAGYIQFVSASGKLSLPAGESIRLPTDGASAVASGHKGAFSRDATVAGTHLRIYTTRLDEQTAIQIARPLTEVDRVLGRLRLLFLLVSLAAVAGAAGVGTAVSRATLRPVRRLTAAAERIAATGDLSGRTDTDRSDELGRLAVAFNTMLDALSRSVGAQRQLVADASHELRTPLASARANLELIELHETLAPDERRRIVNDASAELREMTYLIEELLELARGDTVMLTKEWTRLDHLAEEALTSAARRSSVVFRTQIEPSLIEASPSAVTRAIANLLDNAVKWSPAGAAIEVAVSEGTVSVRDYGPGIDTDDLPHIFDRFYRAPAARTLAGSGLGLAIVRQVAEAHGGTVTAAGADGGGSVFRLILPVRAAAATMRVAAPMSPGRGVSSIEVASPS
jgi:two-component system sensor histidine kinase MprB